MFAAPARLLWCATVIESAFACAEWRELHLIRELKHMFKRLDNRRTCPAWLPADLAGFYAANRPVQRKAGELPDVALHDVDGLALTSVNNYVHMRDLLDAYPEYERWRQVNVVEIGNGLYGDLILYVPVNPRGQQGSIYALGADVAGPPSSLEQPHWLLRIAGSFQDWLERLRQDGWTDYALRPGDLHNLPEHRERALRSLLADLNDDPSWLH